MMSAHPHPAFILIAFAFGMLTCLVFMTAFRPKAKVVPLRPRPRFKTKLEKARERKRYDNKTPPKR